MAANENLNKQQFGATAISVTHGTDTKGEEYFLPSHVGTENHKVTGSKHMEFGKKK